MEFGWNLTGNNRHSCWPEEVFFIVNLEFNIIENTDNVAACNDVRPNLNLNYCFGPSVI
jgi:hypothetical protein